MTNQMCFLTASISDRILVYFPFYIQENWVRLDRNLSFLLHRFARVNVLFTAESRYFAFLIVFSLKFLSLSFPKCIIPNTKRNIFIWLSRVVTIWASALHLIWHKWMNFLVSVTGRDFYKSHAQINWNGQAVFSPQIRLSVQATPARSVSLDEILEAWIRKKRVPLKRILRKIKWHLTFGFSRSNSAMPFRIILHLHTH